MLIIKYKSPFNKLWKNKDPFYEVSLISGKIYRQIKNRKTIKFFISYESFFIKLHYGITISEVLKNIFSFRLPVLDARQELNAIYHLKKFNINTMDVYAVGVKGLNLFTRQSFLITKELNATISLKDYCKNWYKHKPKFQTKINIIRALALIISDMHCSGLNHRDCYLCHFLLDESYYNTNGDIILYIIDLHRAQIRKRIPKRWRDKDLMGIYFSSLELGITNRDIYRFLKTYFDLDLRTIFSIESDLIKKAKNKSILIKKRTERRGL
ncbi:Lipopolysaccharide core heptose(I) kinase RfaP [Candidatus Hartigia pinicola]|nr:Lipopolysaccharide core heptose(I) kinase RfaP [Candidatus Hartigia pinicola]